MPTSALLGPFNGLSNRAADSALPSDKLRNAVNVDFNTDGTLTFPRCGYSSVYAGTNCHSWYPYEHQYGIGLFVEGGALKRLNADFTVTALASVGASEMSYTRVVDTLYFSNGAFSGKYAGGEVTHWGLEAVTRQPIVNAIPTGGMYGGDYRVAITWLCKGEESGTWKSEKVTVTEGGGIHLSQFPTPPFYVDGVCVYVTAVNSLDLYLYDNLVDAYPKDISEVFITRYRGTIPLVTQFGYKPEPKLGLTYHYGRIYWIDGFFIRHTEDQHYGLQRAHSFLPFQEPPTNIISVPGALYVSTDTAIHLVSGIGTDQPSSMVVRNYGAARGAVTYDMTGNNENTAYVISHNGFLKLSKNGIEEFSFVVRGVQEFTNEDFAIPKFKRGTCAVVEHNGSRRLVAIMQEGQISNRQHPDYTAAETARGHTGI